MREIDVYDANYSVEIRKNHDIAIFAALRVEFSKQKKVNHHGVNADLRLSV